MKTEITIKAIRNGFSKVFKAGYCDLQYIMRYSEPQYYNSGIYGWNCDIYANYFHDIAITTGYRNMAGACIPSEILQKYSKIAQEIAEDYKMPYAEAIQKLAENRENFWNALNNL